MGRPRSCAQTQAARRLGQRKKKRPRRATSGSDHQANSQIRHNAWAVPSDYDFKRDLTGEDFEASTRYSIT